MHLCGRSPLVALACLLCFFAGCGTSHGGGQLGTAGSGGSSGSPGTTEPKDQCHTPGERLACSADANCEKGSRECGEGTPNQLGPCRCDEPRLWSRGPRTGGDEIEAAAFNATSFCWGEYHFVSGASYSELMFGPRGEEGEPLFRVPGRVLALRLTETTLYASTDANGSDGAFFAFALTDLQALPAPSRTEAFPAPEAARVKNASSGLELDGEPLTGPVSAFSETADGVYFAPKSDDLRVSYIAFDEPTVETPVLTDAYLPSRLWVSDEDLYVVTVTSDGQGTELLWADLSVLK